MSRLGARMFLLSFEHRRDQGGRDSYWNYIILSPEGHKKQVFSWFFAGNTALGKCDANASDLG